jgi:hypothetical protein
MGTYARAAELMQLLKDHDVRAVADPRSAHAPCVLLTPPQRTYDLPLPAYTVTWSLVVLVPGPATADAWVKLDELTDTVVAALDLSDTTVTPASYQLPGPSEPLPAYIITMTEGTDL